MAEILNKTVLCHGKFDVLHVGHIAYLKEARKLGGRLIVTVTADKFLKDPPHFDEQKRKEALQMVPWIDEVAIIDDPSGIPAIEKFRPDILVKGPDYTGSTDEVLLKEEAAINAIGGRLEIVRPSITFSSTKLKLSKDANFKDLGRTEFQGKFSIADITKFIDDCKRIKSVCLMGETIEDQFQTVELDGQSAKSSCPSFTLSGRHVSQQGGASAIYRHLKEFIPEREIVFHTNYRTPITKLRYLDKFSNKKHFEIKHLPREIQVATPSCPEAAHVIIADFGHGYFSTGPYPYRKIYLMVQTNSSNFGFNVASKWKECSPRLTCIDRTEAALVLRKKIGDTITPYQLAKVREEVSTDTLIVTMHGYGCMLYQNHRPDVFTFPAVASQVVDTIGAGDTFFTFATLAQILEYPPEKVLMIASLAAAVSTQWLCNAEAVTPEKLLKTAKIVL